MTSQKQDQNINEWMKEHGFTLKDIHYTTPPENIEQVGPYMVARLGTMNAMMVYIEDGTGTFRFIGTRKIQKGNKFTLHYVTHKLQKLIYNKDLI